MEHNENCENDADLHNNDKKDNFVKYKFNKTLLDFEVPAIVSRKLLSKILGGLISPRTIANWDCLGLAPKVKVRIGRNIGYTRNSVLEWLEDNLEVENA
ncbi:MAG: hypothetical protein JEZ12_03200 [Desulfobacterium sp.]|nr:hypothetical protein [Desulfobacterium sp.]